MDLQSALWTVIRGRRSIRIYDDSPVEEEKVRALIEAAQWAPSSCNKQLWEFVIVRDRALKEALVREAGAQPQVANAPLLIYVIYPSNVNDYFSANIQSAAAAIQNMLLMAHALGLGACWVIGCGERRAVLHLLGIPDSYTLVAAISVGHARPEGMEAVAPERRPYEELVHDERYEPKDPKVAGGRVKEWTVETFVDYRMRGVRATSPFHYAFEDLNTAEVQREVELALSLLPEGGRALDVLSFGGEQLLRMLCRKGAEFFSYELSQSVADFLDEKRRRSGIKGRIHYLVGGAYAIPAQDSFFDLVTCFKKLGKVPEPERLFAEMRRVLRPEGRLVVSLRNSKGISALVHMLRMRLLGDRGLVDNEGPIEPLSIRRARRFVRSQGFTILREVGINLLPAPLHGDKLGLVGYQTIGPLRHLCRTAVFVCRRED